MEILKFVIGENFVLSSIEFPLNIYVINERLELMHPWNIKDNIRLYEAVWRVGFWYQWHEHLFLYTCYTLVPKLMDKHYR